MVVNGGPGVGGGTTDGADLIFEARKPILKLALLAVR